MLGFWPTEQTLEYFFSRHFRSRVFFWFFPSFSVCLKKGHFLCPMNTQEKSIKTTERASERGAVTHANDIFFFLTVIISIQDTPHVQSLV